MGREGGGCRNGTNMGWVLMLDGTSDDVAHVRSKAGIFREEKTGFVTAVELKHIP